MLSSSTVSDWLKDDAVKKVRDAANLETANDSKAHVGATRVREPKCPQLEAALTLWFFDKQAKDGTLTDEAVSAKAKQLDDEFPELDVPQLFGFSRGWVSNKRSKLPALNHGEVVVLPDSDVAGLCNVPLVAQAAEPVDEDDVVEAVEQLHAAIAELSLQAAAVAELSLEAVLDDGDEVVTAATYVQLAGERARARTGLVL